jgi:hypothetical protein
LTEKSSGAIFPPRRGTLDELALASVALSFGGGAEAGREGGRGTRRDREVFHEMKKGGGGEGREGGRKEREGGEGEGGRKGGREKGEEREGEEGRKGVREGGRERGREDTTYQSALGPTFKYSRNSFW